MRKAVLFVGRDIAVVFVIGLKRRKSNLCRLFVFHLPKDDVWREEAFGLIYWGHSAEFNRWKGFIAFIPIIPLWCWIGVRKEDGRCRFLKRKGKILLQFLEGGVNVVLGGECFFINSSGKRLETFWYGQENDKLSRLWRVKGIELHFDFPNCLRWRMCAFRWI